MHRVMLMENKIQQLSKSQAKRSWSPLHQPPRLRPYQQQRQQAQRRGKTTTKGKQVR